MTRNALITGLDSNAIARVICSSLFESGYDVYAPVESPDELKEESLHKAHLLNVDYGSAESLTSLLDQLAVRTYGVVLNCATTLAVLPDGSLRNESTSFDYAEFNRVLQYNVTSVAAICLGIADAIEPGGCIINLTSSAAREGAFATVSYNASKAAVDNLTHSLANILGISRGIRVNSIAAGWIPPSDDAATADGASTYGGGIWALTFLLDDEWDDANLHEIKWFETLKRLDKDGIPTRRLWAFDRKAGL